jgi:hypothetical protein
LLEALAAAIDGTPIALWAAGDAYRIINVVHVLGLVLLLGAIGIVDLRLVGAFQSLPCAALRSALTPLAIAGLMLMLVSGLLLFAADAAALAGSSTFRWKLLLVALGIGNALLFGLLWRRLPETRAVPLGAKALALLSLSTWLAVAVLGRWIAYA